MTWTKAQIDALAEIFTLGVGRAAATLNEMIGREIDISLPSVRFLGHDALEDMLERELSNNAIAVRQSFRGDVNGTAVLFLLEESSAPLIRILLEDGLSGADVEELEADALSELGNIILNSCLGAIANTLGRDFTIDLPAFAKGAPAAIIPASAKNPGEPSILVHIDFNSRPAGIGGLVALFIDGPGMKELRDTIDEFVISVCA